MIRATNTTVTPANAGASGHQALRFAALRFQLPLE